MSSKKSKLLESAQKNLLKGQYDRAALEYRQIIELDPHDLRHRQKLAEILTKANQKDEAVKEYSALAKHYVDSAHHLKAIAVYKQIQKLDPTNPETSLTLASLNETQGLIGNATAEYAVAVQIYEKNGENLKALKALENMMSLDSRNSAVKLRIAEKYFTTGSEEKSFNTFVSLLQDLKEINDENGFNLISEKAINLFGHKIIDVIEQNTEKGSDDNQVIEDHATLHPNNLTIQPDFTLTEPADSGLPPEPTENVLFSENTDTEPSEELEYIEDILPIDDIDQNDHSGRRESSDEWEEEIDLISLNTEFETDEAHQLADLDFLEELDELDELELEIDDATSIESDSFSDTSPFKADGTFDLGKDLSMFADELDIDLFSSQNSDTIFDNTDAGFKKGELDNEDTESHYSLGLAYKEMGLFDEAISEFIIASLSGNRKIDSLILQGVCFRELGSIAKAVEMLSDTLNDASITEDEYLGVQYEIALCHETDGSFDKARIMLTEIIAARPAYSDVATRLKNLPI